MFEVVLFSVIILMFIGVFAVIHSESNKANSSQNNESKSTASGDSTNKRGEQSLDSYLCECRRRKDPYDITDIELH